VVLGGELEANLRRGSMIVDNWWQLYRVLDGLFWPLPSGSSFTERDDQDDPPGSSNPEEGHGRAPREDVIIEEPVLQLIIRA
jgi:hypothetical protein